MSNKHEWKNVELEGETKKEHLDVLKKYGIESLIHSSCKKLQERTCMNCKKTVSVAQLDANNKMIFGTLVPRNFDFNLCEVK